MKPDTFLLTLPNGEKVRCWAKDADKIRHDVMFTGNVFLRRDHGSEVYEYIDPASVEAVHVVGQARHVQ